MPTTPVSLLERLRQPIDQDAWSRFVNLYLPLLFHWARRLGLRQDDAADLVQDVLTTLVQELPEFTYDPARSFRGWLWTLMRNRHRNYQRRRPPQSLDASPAIKDALPGPEPDEELTEMEYRRLLLGRALRLIRADFQPATWTAFWECAVNGRSPREVASELGMTESAVHSSKFRVLSRIRQELHGLLD